MTPKRHLSDTENILPSSLVSFFGSSAEKSHGQRSKPENPASFDRFTPSSFRLPPSLTHSLTRSLARSLSSWLAGMCGKWREVKPLRPRLLFSPLAFSVSSRVTSPRVRRFTIAGRHHDNNSNKRSRLNEHDANFLPVNLKLFHTWQWKRGQIVPSKCKESRTNGLWMSTAAARALPVIPCVDS